MTNAINFRDEEEMVTFLVNAVAKAGFCRESDVRDRVGKIVNHNNGRYNFRTVADQVDFIIRPTDSRQTADKEGFYIPTYRRLTDTRLTFPDMVKPIVKKRIKKIDKTLKVSEMPTSEKPPVANPIVGEQTAIDFKTPTPVATALTDSERIAQLEAKIAEFMGRLPT